MEMAPDMAMEYRALKARMDARAQGREQLLLMATIWVAALAFVAVVFSAFTKLGIGHWPATDSPSMIATAQFATGLFLLISGLLFVLGRLRMLTTQNEIVMLRLDFFDAKIASQKSGLPESKSRPASRLKRTRKITTVI
jgi:hypothetical protein